jgi:hypothetical protein
MLGSQVTNKQTGYDPPFLELLDCNKETTHSDTLSVFLQLQSWLFAGMFCKRTIFCVSYMQIHVLMSDYSDSESLDSDSDVTTTSSRKHLRSTGPLISQFPHTFFLAPIKAIFITV